MRLEYPDRFSQAVLRPAGPMRRTAFLVGDDHDRARLAPFFRANASRLRDLPDADVLRRECTRLWRAHHPSVVDRFRGAVRSVFDDVSVSYKDWTVSATIANHQPKIGVLPEDTMPVVRIQEDEIHAELLGRYFDCFLDIPPEACPTFFIEAKTSIEMLIPKLQLCSDQIMFHVLGAQSVLRRFTIDTHGCTGIASFIEQYREQALSSAAFTPYEVVEGTGTGLPSPQALMLQLCRLRAVAERRGRAFTFDEAQRLRTALASQEQGPLTGADAPKLLTVKALANLWLLYCTERTRDLFDNSMAIACALGDPVLQAHVLRYIGMIEPPGSFSEFCLQRANAIFVEHGLFDLACYCVNNLFTGRFYGTEPLADDYQALTEEAKPHLAGISAMRIIYNNAAVAAMLEERYDVALRSLDDGLAVAGSELHAVGITVNRVIVERMLGATIDGDRLLTLVRRAACAFDRSHYSFHLANVAFNALAASTEGSEARAEITRLCSELELFDARVVEKYDRVLPIQLKKLGFPVAGTGVPAGIRGSFIARTAFVPVIHHTWL